VLFAVGPDEVPLPVPVDVLVGVPMLVPVPVLLVLELEPDGDSVPSTGADGVAVPLDVAKVPVDVPSAGLPPGDGRLGV
jgi:hypothetical protein